MTKQVQVTDTNGQKMVLFVSGQGSSRDGQPTLLVSKVEGSAYVFSVAADRCEEV